MLKLYGFDVSNYYNMIKLAMSLKGVEFEAVHTYPNQSEEYLAICPTGKVPALQIRNILYTQVMHLNELELKSL